VFNREVLWGGEKQFQLIYQDITERKQAEEELQLSQLTLERITDAIAWLNPDGQYIYVNDATCHRFGVSRDKLLSMHVWDFNPDFSKEAWGEFWKELKSRGSMTFESRHSTKDGKIITVEINSNYLKFNGMEFSSAVARDITERKQTEVALRKSEKQASAAIEAARALTFNYDIATGKIEWGGAIEEITGYTREEFAEIDIEGWANRIHPDDRDEVLSILQEAMGKDRATAEYRFKTKKGYVTLVSISLTEKQDGKAVRLAGILQDVTELKQAEEREKQLQRELILTSRLASVGQMAAGIAHEINNPLTGVVGFSDLLMKKDIPEDIRKDVEIIYDGAQREP